MSSMPTAKLGDVAEFVRGITFKPTDVVPVDTPGSVRCMRTKNVQTQLDLSDVWAVGSGFIKRGNQFLRAGDLLVSSANSWNLVGKCSWVPELGWDATFGGFISVLRADESKILPRYLYHWFSAGRTQTIVRSFGRQTTNISNLDFGRCLAMEIPLPPMGEQWRIAEVLDRVVELRAKRRHAIALFDDLAQSIFLDMFGDPTRNPAGLPKESLTDICKTYSGGTPSKADPQNWEGSLPWFSAKDMKQKNLYDSIDRINDDVPQMSSLRLLPENTVAIVVRGMILAHTFPVCVLRRPSTINQDLKALIPVRDIHPDFLADCLRVQSDYILSRVSRAAHGTTRLDNEALRSIGILIPPADQQAEYVARVASVERLTAVHRASMAELDNLFASVQQRAFRGVLWNH